MQCSRCERANRKGAQFCMGCGAPLPRECATCGQALPPEAAFCDACGQRVEARPEARPARSGLVDSAPGAYTPRHLADRILGSRTALEGERKNVTVLFADLENSTPLAERLGAEPMHELMDRCFRIILAEVHRFEGTVNQFAGDGAMALFGAPLALEDAPLRGVQAALRIQRALDPLAAEVRRRYDLEFRMRIGIHSGPVVVGSIGDDLRMDYTAVGDTTNLANRLQTLARPGTVVISQTTADLVEGYFDLQDLGAKKLKGKSAPVRVYEVHGERGVRGRVEAGAATGLTPLVGRKRELDALESAFRSAEAGAGQVTFVVGEAGLGKSRLLFELRQRLAETPHVWIEGRCASYGRNAAFHCIADAYRRRFAIDERDDDEAALAKLQRAAGDDPEIEASLPFFRSLLSLPIQDARVEAMDAMERRSETFRAIHTDLLRAAERTPLIFVVEDLHWIDPASEELVGYLSETVPTARILLVLTHRNGYRQPFGERSFHRQVALQALSLEDTEAMACALLEAETVPGGLRELIAGKAEGNPFFVEEVTKSLHETRAVTVENGRVAMASHLSATSVPDRIQDVLAARLDRLEDGPKQAIQTAAVIGREFALRLLQRIVAQGHQVSEVVEELRALELIYQKASHPELAYMFKHALTHDVAYESLLEQRRRALHRMVGLAIEELYPDRLAEHYEPLAHHFLQAEEWEKALHYHELAERKAIDAYANQSAAEHARAALALAERLQRPAELRAEILERLAGTLGCLSDFRGSGEAYVQAAELFPAGERRAASLARAAFSYVWGHEYEACKETAERARSEARTHGCVGPEVIARVALDLYTATHRGPSALSDHAAETSRLALTCTDREARSCALAQEALFTEQVGDYPRALDLAQRALEEAQGLRASQASLYPRWALGLSLACMGRYGEALASLRAGLDQCHRIGARAMVARLLNTIGWLHAEIGCAAAASDYNRVATELGRQLVELEFVAGAPELHANGAINLAGNLLTLGEAGQAADVLAPLYRPVESPDDLWQHWRYKLHMDDVRARLAIATGELDAARELTLTQLAGAQTHLSPKLEARAGARLGQILLRMNERADAEAALRTALGVAERIGYPPVQWRARALLAEIARRDGDASAAAAEARAARLQVERLASTLEADDLARPFRALGEQLAEDPLAACR